MRRALLGRAVPAALLAAAAAAGLPGCLSPRPTPPVTYYTLAVPGRPPLAPPAGVQVGAFSADAPYATARLAWRSSPFRLEYYAFHRWADAAPGAVATALRDYLEQPAGARDGAPFVVGGHLRRLEALADPGGWQGVVALDLAVRRSGRIWLERSYQESEEARGETPEEIVAALSRALGRIADRLLGDLAAAAP